jgi:sirohydrochlorin ferrochelatase/tetratricopeptide (TPR) repeat protein
LFINCNIGFARRADTGDTIVRMSVIQFPDATLLIIGHGSTVNGDSGATVFQHAAELRRRALFADVREAFFKIEPRIGVALAAIRTPRVFVVPLFVSEGYFTRQAIPCELGLPAGTQDVMPCRARLAGREVIYCHPVGTHPLMTEIILARAGAVLGGILEPHSVSADEARETRRSTALVIAGHGTALNSDSRKSIEHQVALVAARGLFAEVHPAFLEEAPRIADIPGFVRSPRIVVVPFFMSDGLHVCEDIPVLLGEEESVVQQRLKAGEWTWRNPTARGGKTIYYTRGVGSEPGIAARGRFLHQCSFDVRPPLPFFAVDFCADFPLIGFMPEIELSGLPREVRQLHTKGIEALQRDNFDYAVDLLMQVLKNAPGCVDCRRALRQAQVGKAGAGGGLFKKMLSGASTAPLVAKGQLALRNNPGEALQIAEQILTTDPNSSAGHKLAAEAALAMEMPRTAVLSLEVLARTHSRDKHTIIQFGTALADIGEVARAERALADLLRQMPTDPEVAQALKNLSARRTLNEGGYEKAEQENSSYRDMLKDKQEAARLEQESRMVRSEDTAERLIHEYETRLAGADAGNAKLMRSLAELYTQKKRFDEAMRCYERLKASETGADPTLDKAITETKVRQMEHQIAQLDPTSEDYAARQAALTAERQTLQLEECRRRVEKFPTDLGIRYELGVLYFQAGKISEAIQEFQKAQNNPHKRIAALGYLAQCFGKRKMFDLAARTLQNALKEKLVFDEEKKDLVYQLGSMLEAMGKKEEAIEQFKLIYEADIGYRDVAAKVDAYYAGQ